MQVELIMVDKTIDQDGKPKVITQFFLKCNHEIIGVQPTYHKGKNGEPDRTYQNRKAILKAFATPVLPADLNSSRMAEE